MRISCKFDFRYHPVLHLITEFLEKDASRLELDEGYCIIIVKAEKYAFFLSENNTLAKDFEWLLGIMKVGYAPVQSKDLVRIRDRQFPKHIVSSQHPLFKKYLQTM